MAWSVDPYEEIEAQASAGIKKRGEPYNPGVEEMEALDGLFGNVTHVLPQFLGLIFSEYQRGIISGSGEINL
jgi:hypothetical protein